MVKPVEYLGEGNILFLDISSSCTGWCIGNFNKLKLECSIIYAGVFWFNEELTHGKKYFDLCQFITNLCKVHNIIAVCAEAYFLNAYQLAGGAICPEIQGAVKSWLQTLNLIPIWTTIPPTSWRASIGIKKDATKAGSAAWKSPTREKVEEILGKLPDKIVSNITKNMRNTPSDLFDALGICMGYLSKEPNNCKTFTIAKNAI